MSNHLIAPRDGQKLDRKNKTKNTMLFDEIGSNEFYQNVKNEIRSWHKPAKIYWQKIYDKHRMYLDDNYVSEFSSNNCVSRLWELTQINYLAEHTNKGVALRKLTGKASKPDFCFDLLENSFYLEAVCAGPGENPELNATLAEVSGKARGETPVTEYKERLCAEIKLKGDTKYYDGKTGKTPGYKTYMEKHPGLKEHAGLIIAVSMAKIPFHNQPNNINVDLSCLFAMSAMKIPLIRSQVGTRIVGEPYYDHQPRFNKSNNNASIETCYFSGKRFSHISAVLISHAFCHAYFPGIASIDELFCCCPWKNCSNDYTLVHNPFAKTPLPKGFFDVANEVMATTNPAGLEISIKNATNKIPTI